VNRKNPAKAFNAAIQRWQKARYDGYLAESPSTALHNVIKTHMDYDIIYFHVLV
jgi:hypothetical protein